MRSPVSPGSSPDARARGSRWSEDGQLSVIRRPRRLIDTFRRPPIGWPPRGLGGRRPRGPSGRLAPRPLCRSTSRQASVRETLGLNRKCPGGDCADRGSARDRRGTFDWGVWTMPLAFAAGAVNLCVLNRGGDFQAGLTIVRQRVVCAWTMPSTSQEPGFHGRWRRSSGVFCPYSCARTHLGCACRCTRRTRTPRTSGSIRTCQRRHVLRRLSDGPRPP